MLQLITNKDIYEQVIRARVPAVKQFLWIATADIKDMYVHSGNQMVPFLKVLEDRLRKKVAIRLIHAREPGEAFQKDFDKYPLLYKNLERVCCPRVHFKAIIGDGKWAYTGSANLTGAGMGAKSPAKRNFENGIISDEERIIDPLMEQFDRLWIGKECKSCNRKDQCIDRIDML